MEIVPDVIHNCFKDLNADLNKNVSRDISRLWSEIVSGDDFPELDRSITSQKQADRVAQQDQANLGNQAGSDNQVGDDEGFEPVQRRNKKKDQ